MERRAGIPEEDQPLSREGRAELDEVIRVLVEQCSDVIGDEGIRLRTIWHGSYKHVSQTATAIAMALPQVASQRPPASLWRKLDPSEFWKGRSTGKHVRIARVLERVVRSSALSDRSAILVVGHQPHLGWIAEGVLGRPLPIARCEVVCIAIAAAPSSGTP